MSDTAPCPNCRKSGDEYNPATTVYHCPDEACPVKTYDWNGEYD